ncbi:MAG: glycoside hydrolase family 99-like domain-containing protein, partial [Anaerolineae bacterium]|nr:glycoside hydrolase family 99-like domain-containing protein [Anaerolineae bacterium]
MAQPYQIGAYYFPNYHVDPRNERLYGSGWTEWELLRWARSRFPGHRQPRVPAWGYEDEADPQVFAHKIAAAADHGLTHFLFDWYWYDDGPFLNRCLEEGYLKAGNRERLQFALMWANHNWVDLFPMKRSMQSSPQLLYSGAVTAQTFETMTD